MHICIHVMAPMYWRQRCKQSGRATKTVGFPIWLTTLALTLQILCSCLYRVKLCKRERERMGSTYRVCVCFTRRFRVTEAEPPPDVKEVFKTYSEGGAQMTAEHLRRFLVEVQGEAGATIADAERLLEQILRKRHHIAKFTRRTLSLDDFHQFLFSIDLNPPIASQV